MPASSMGHLLTFSVAALCLVRPSRAVVAARGLASPCTDVATKGTGWLVSNFQYSDAVTGGSESSLADVVSIAFTITSTATGQPTACSANVTLDQGVKWDPRSKYDCQPQPGLSTQFAFDSASDELSIYQTWSCPDAGKLAPFQILGNGTIPLSCKVHEGARKNDCAAASATLNGSPVH